MIEGSSSTLNLKDELAVRANQQAAVAELGQLALEGADLQSLMDSAARQVALRLGVEFCKVLELLPDEEHLLLRAGVGWRPGLVGRARVGAGLDSQAGYALFTRQPVIVEDLSREERFHGPELLLEHGVISGLSVIIGGARLPFGVLGAHSRERRTFSADDIHFLKAVANILGAAIQRKRTENELQALNASLEQRIVERTGYLRLLHAVGTAANQATSLKPVLQLVLDRVCAFTGWPVGHVYLAEQGELVSGGLWRLQEPQRYRDFKRATASTRLKPGEGLPGRAAASGEPAWAPDLAGEAGRRGAAEAGLRSGLAFPVMAGGQTAAVLEFYSAEPFEPEQALLDVLAQVGSILGRLVERERTAEELRRREAQLAEAQRIVHLGSWEWEPESNRLEWSDELYRIYGLADGQPIGTYEAFLERVHPADRELTIQAMERALASQDPFEFTHRIVRPDGGERMIQVQGRPLLGEDGRLRKLVGTGLDITERSRMEEALRESMDLLGGLFESSPDGSALVSEEGRILRLNREMEKLFGYSREELLGQPLEILLPERYRESHRGHRQAYTRSARTRPMGVGLELYGLRKDGREFPVDILLSPLKTARGLLTICVVRDVTEQHRAAEALRASEARFRAIFEAAAIGMAGLDLQQRILIFNPRLQEILGYPAGELQGLDLAGLCHPDDRENFRRLYGRLIAANRDYYQAELRFTRRDGGALWGNLTVSLVRNKDGQPLFTIGMLEDITPRKQMEAELAEVQHRLLASREGERVQLAQEIHDVPMQDLYAVLFGLNEFEEAAAERPELAASLEETRSGLQQVIQTLRSICGELRPPTLAPFGLAGAILEHIEGFRQKYPGIRVELDIRYDGKSLNEVERLNLFRIYQQALTNVARHSGAKNVAIHLSREAGRVSLEVADDGCGFEVPERWVRLAREGHLGLVGSVERAEMIGGRLEVVSAPGRGTRVRVSIPQAAEEARPA